MATKRPSGASKTKKSPSKRTKKQPDCSSYEQALQPIPTLTGWARVQMVLSDWTASLKRSVRRVFGITTP